MRKNLIGFLLSVILLFSCGGGDAFNYPGNQLNSSTVYISVSPAQVNADTALGIDTNNDNFCESYVIQGADTVNLEIRATLLPGLPQGIPASPILVRGIKVSYNPATPNSPRLNSVFLRFSTVLDPNVIPVINIPVVILSSGQKEEFIVRYGVVNTNVVVPEFRYIVTLEVELEEELSGKVITVPVYVTMYVSDYIQQGECIWR